MLRSAPKVFNVHETNGYLYFTPSIVFRTPEYATSGVSVSRNLSSSANIMCCQQQLFAVSNNYLLSAIIICSLSNNYLASAIIFSRWHNRFRASLNRNGYKFSSGRLAPFFCHDGGADCRTFQHGKSNTRRIQPLTLTSFCRHRTVCFKKSSMTVFVAHCNIISRMSCRAVDDDEISFRCHLIGSR